MAPTQVTTFSMLIFTILIPLSSSATDTTIYGGCSTLKYTPTSPYESNLNSLLTSFINSATRNTYNTFTIQSSKDTPTLYGLYQCRGDITAGPDCSHCIARAVIQLGKICANACGGTLQLEGCFVKYEKTSFFGVADKTVMVNKCGPVIDRFDSDESTLRDVAFGYMADDGGGKGIKPYRVIASGKVHGLAQCSGDLGPSECQNCLSDAVGQLKNECGAARWGDVFLAKCYARFSEKGSYSRANDSKLSIQKAIWFIVLCIWYGFIF